MKRILRLRPSPAMVVACLALGVALGGTSVAAIQALPKNSVGPLQLKKNAVNTTKVKNRSLLAVDFKAGQLPKGDPGAPGAPGAKGDPGTPGSALAFARILGTGAVDDANSKGIATANVTKIGAGAYCISGLAFTPKNPVATLESPLAAPDLIIRVGIGVGPSSCAAGTQVRVFTTQDHNFYLALN